VRAVTQENKTLTKQIIERAVDLLLQQAMADNEV